MKKVKSNEKKTMHVKERDKVVVITGKSAKEIGTVKKIDYEKSTVIVEGVNMVTKAVKPNPMAGVQGGLTKLEAPINSSNVMLYCSACNKATRVKYEVKDGKKVRVCKKCGKPIDLDL